jgi:hypothetical protein
LALAPKETVAVSWVDEFGHATRAKIRLASGPPE